MTVIIDADTLCQCFPHTSRDTLELYVDGINEAAERFGIYENVDRMAMFLAQIGHESGGLRTMEENLNYSASGLMKVFHKYFPDQATADEYARKPEKIANRVYASRMGNGDEGSGDGWNFRGRGAIQLTGRDNYTKFAHDIGMDMEEVVDYLSKDHAGPIMSAAWFWNSRKLNDYADRLDISGCTQRINGGQNGIEERTAYYNSIKEILGG